MENHDWFWYGIPVLCIIGLTVCYLGLGACYIRWLNARDRKRFGCTISRNGAVGLTVFVNIIWLPIWVIHMIYLSLYKVFYHWKDWPKRIKNRLADIYGLD